MARSYYSPEDPVARSSRRHTSPTTERPRAPPRVPSRPLSDSDDSISSPERPLDDDTDFFMVQANDSESSLGVTTFREMSMSIDLEELHRLSPISRLPPELLISIFAKLSSTSDLRNCMLVSYNWAINCVGVLWHRPQCNEWANLRNVTTSLSCNPSFPYHEMVRRLNLAALHDKVNDGTIQAFMNCKKIERLTLTNCSKLTDSGVSVLVEGNRHLQALDVTDIRSLTDHTLSTVAMHCPRLQGLNVTNCSKLTDESLVAVAENCRQLKRLKLNNLNLITDKSIITFAENCSSILEIDLHCCTPITSDSVTALLSHLYHLRELRLAHCAGVTDSAFLNLPATMDFDYLRILDLTGCEEVRDDAIARIIPATPKLRNLVLAKCKYITDRAVLAICRLGKNLHYIHLGHCVNLTDNAVIALVKSCNRIRYIDLACCSRLTDQSVVHLAQLPKLRRIGLVKCQQLTDFSIQALARGAMSGGPGHVRPGCLERVHLSYCVSLTLQGIHELLQFCPRLTHLSLTGVQAFLRDDLTRFCRPAPPEFTHPQRDVFCVFSGDGVLRLREYLKRLAEDQEQEGRASRDGSGAYSEAGVDSGRDTISDDETLDVPEETPDRRYLLQGPARSRAYAEFAPGHASSSMNADSGEDSYAGGASSSEPRSDRRGQIFWNRSRPGSLHVEDADRELRGYLNGHYRREASRSASEGQETSTRPRFEPSEMSMISGFVQHLEQNRSRPPPEPRSTPPFEYVEEYGTIPEGAARQAPRSNAHIEDGEPSGSGVGHTNCPRGDDFIALVDRAMEEEKARGEQSGSCVGGANVPENSEFRVLLDRAMAEHNEKKRRSRTGVDGANTPSESRSSVPLDRETSQLAYRSGDDEGTLVGQRSRRDTHRVMDGEMED